MIVTLDLSRLLLAGKITKEEYDRFLLLGEATGGRLLFNILIGFGVVAVAAGVIALVPDATTGIVIGGALLVAGLYIKLAQLKQWSVLAGICILIGALTLAGGLIVLTDAQYWAFVMIAAGFLILSVPTQSGLLSSLAVLSFSSAFGARTGYLSASYFLGISAPSETIVVFSALALTFLLLSRHVPFVRRVSLFAARTSVLLVNLGFWIASLFGDTVEWLNLDLPDWAFALAWAIALAVLGFWAARENRRWVVNVAAIFGAIHLYTQWFENLGLQPMSVLIGGLAALVIAMVLRSYNRNAVGAEATEAA